LTLIDRVHVAEELARQGEPEGVLEVFAKSYRSTLDGGKDGLRMQVLLALEHRMVHRVDLAFFKINAVLGIVVFALVWAGL